MAKRRWWHGLFGRVTFGYALGALLVSSAMAFLSMTVAESRLLSEEEAAARQQFFANARIIRDDLDRAVGGDAEQLDEIKRVAIEENVRHTDQTKTTLITGDSEVGSLPRREIPQEILAALTENPIVANRYRWTDDELEETRYFLAISLKNLESLEGDDAKYIEAISFEDLERTLGNLRQVLIAAAIVATLAGAALGYYSARRALAPVAKISNAAKSIADGNFTTRLDLQTDPDLEGLSASFNEMADALSARIARDERFASDVSHELRSPLMTLTASVEVLERRKSSLPEIAQTAVTLLRQDLTRFERLVEDLLEISRLDAGAVQLQLSSFLLSEFLLNVVAQSRSPEIEINHPNRDSGLTLTADKRRLAQVITNLVDNAKKYGDGATGISFKRVGEQVQILVEDRGPGVDPADRKRIFERFSRTASDAGRRGVDTGVGLGLSLVAEHVRLHGGRVWVTDRVDGDSGARFVVELPVGEYDEGSEEMAV